jgi:hypothetical protein
MVPASLVLVTTALALHQGVRAEFQVPSHRARDRRGGLHLNPPATAHPLHESMLKYYVVPYTIILVIPAFQLGFGKF